MLLELAISSVLTSLPPCAKCGFKNNTSLPEQDFQRASKHATASAAALRMLLGIIAESNKDWMLLYPEFSQFASERDSIPHTVLGSLTFIVELIMLLSTRKLSVAVTTADSFS